MAGASLVETLMRAGLVIVDQELLDHGLQVGSAEDGQVVEQLPACCADEPFADRVRPGRSIGELHDFDALGAEDLIEAGGALGISIVEQVGGLEGAVLQHPGQVAGLLGHPLAGGMGGDTGEMDLAAMELNKEEDVEAGAGRSRR